MNSAKSYIKAGSVEQAISLARENAGCFRYLAGGTDVMVNRFQGNDNAGVLIDVSGIVELKNIKTTDTHLVLGAMLCLSELKHHSLIANDFPLLIEAADSVASPTIRRTATLGGNILCENRCLFYNQSEWWREAAGKCLKSGGDTCLASGGKKNCFSKFVSDTAVALISLSADVEVVNSEGVTIKPIESIYTGDGVNPRKHEGEAFIKAIHIPLRKNFLGRYMKLRKRETIDFTSLTTAVTLDNTERIRIVLGGVHSKPVIVDGRVGDKPDDLINQAVSDTRLVDNDTYPRAYRKEMISVFLKKSFKELNLG